MNESRARDEICRIGASLFDRGYVHATAGNISVRLDDGGFLITPTDACLGFLEPSSLARVDAQGAAVGEARPSKTLQLHRAIYASATKFEAPTRCIIHTHSTHCVALSLKASGDELLAPITPYFVMKVGHVPLIPYSRPGSPETVQAVARQIEAWGERRAPIRAVMLQRLGPNVWHDSPASAMAVLEELEETAKLALLAPDTSPLGDKDIAGLRETFGSRW